MVELKGYKINSISFENKAKNGTQLKLQNQLKYRVNYIKDQTKCVGDLEFRIADADMQPFEIKISIWAEFQYDEYMEKSEIHTESFAQIFPFLRQIINNITTMSGMPALMIPMMKLDKNNVTSPDGATPLDDTFLS